MVMWMISFILCMMTAPVYGTKGTCIVSPDFAIILWGGTYTVSVEKYHYTKEPFADFLGMGYSYESDDPEDCLNHLTEDILWDGKSFFDLEKALTWFDWEEA